MEKYLHNVKLTSGKERPVTFLKGVERDRMDMLEIERDIWSQGLEMVAGVDEAGRGALAGPLVAAAVVLPAGRIIPGVRDSKQLTPSRREDLFSLIVREAVAWSWSCVSPKEIDDWGLREANLVAMRDAVDALRCRLDIVLVDLYTIPDLEIPQENVVKGDQRCQCIAAASILAKVLRDRMMRHIHFFYPQYGFSQHKGYGTARHLEALDRWGPCPYHRMTYHPVIQTRMVLWE